MQIPPQGFRHAVALLLTNSSRAIPVDAPPEVVAAALLRLAHDLVALADDMRAKPDSAEWLLTEYNSTLQRLPHVFDREKTSASAAAILARVSVRSPAVESRDIFLVYLPEDRLPVAAPLAIELTKRRVSVAFNGYEVATSDHLAAAIEHGLNHHLGGALLWTNAFARSGWRFQPEESDRLRLLRKFDDSVIEDLADWARRLRATKSVAK